MDRLMTPKEICETSISALCEHCTVRLTGKPESIPCGIYDNRAAAAKAQRDLTSAYYEGIMAQKIAEALKQPDAYRDIKITNLINNYEAVIIPQKIKEAEKKLFADLWAGCLHYSHIFNCPKCRQKLMQSRGIA